MIPVVVLALVNAIPAIVGVVETLSSHKAAISGAPLAGSEKLKAVTTIAMTALQTAGIIDPKHIGPQEETLAQDVSNVVVKYANARQLFTHVEVTVP